MSPAPPALKEIGDDAVHQVSQVYQEIPEVHVVHEIQEQIVETVNVLPQDLISVGIVVLSFSQAGDDPWMSLPHESSRRFPRPTISFRKSTPSSASLSILLTCRFQRCARSSSDARDR